MGLAEAQKRVGRFLQAPPVARDANAVADALALRPEYEYLVCRGQDPDPTLMIVVRSNMAKSIKRLQFERLVAGKTKAIKDGDKVKEVKTCYSRCMVAEISLDQSVGGFGKEIRVMAVHMHNELANGGKWKTAYTQFWARCYDLCKTHNVDVLMGDFNMSLFRVIPEFRSRGVTIDSAAWYPWKSPTGIPCSDSCGIFCLKKLGIDRLEVGLHYSIQLHL
jgi:hypothetical protein